MKKLTTLASSAFLLMGTLGTAQATDLFSADVTLGSGESGRVGFSKIEDLVDSLDNSGYQRIVDAYTDTSIATGELSVRGLRAIAAYETTGTTLRFAVPTLGINETFTGATRDESQQLFEDFLENNGNNILSDMLNELAGTTLVDPVAGNPNSLMSRMAGAAFGAGSTVGENVNGTSQGAAVENKISLAARFGRYSAGDFEQDTISVPLSYTYYFDDPDYQLIFDMPFDYIDTEGAASYNTSIGLGFKFPILDNWSLTPAARVGGVGSIDLGSAAVIYSGSLTSNYDFYYEDLKLAVGNMAGYYQTQSLSVGDYEIDYGLSNTVIKNGISAEGSLDFTLFDKPTSWQTSVAHTHFFGDELAVDSYFDVAVSFGTRTTPGASSWNDIRLGVTYTFGDDYDGIQANLGYKF